MKRATFKKPFNGMDNALKVIPESYKIDGNRFEVTDGIETYIVKWEGSLTEGTGSVLLSANKTLINEDMDKMKHLMGFKSQDTLGLVHGAARIDENESFKTILGKTKAIITENENASNGGMLGFANEGDLVDDGITEAEVDECDDIEDSKSEEKLNEMDGGYGFTSENNFGENEMEAKEIKEIDTGDMVVAEYNASIDEMGTAQQIADLTGADDEEMGNIQGALDMDKEAGLNEEGDAGGSGIADIKAKLLAMRGDVQNGELSAVERTVIMGMLDMIEFFGADGNQFKGQVRTKLQALQAAMEQAAQKSDAKASDTAEISTDQNLNQGIGMNEDEVEETDRFDEIFEGMYESDDELKGDQDELDVEPEGGDGDIDAKDLAKLRKDK